MNRQCQKSSIYSRAYWLIQDKAHYPDILIYMIDILWPSFIEKDGWVFLEEKFSNAYYTRLLGEDSNPEYWINLLTIDEFFQKWTIAMKSRFFLQKGLLPCGKQN